MRKVDLIDDRIYNLANDKQKKSIDAYREHGLEKAAEILGTATANICKHVARVLEKAAKVEGYAPYAGMTQGIAEGFIPKRISTFYNEEGQVSRQWVIQEPEREKMISLLKEVTDEILEDVKPLPLVEFEDRNLEKDLMVNIPIGDAHIGMLAWGVESGANYDLKIAEAVHKKAVEMLISQTPNAENCTIIDLGDFLHADNARGMTEASGNVLDCDGRHRKAIFVAIEIALHYIDTALTKFKHVTFRPEPGNHNDVGAMWMAGLLIRLYKNEPRVTIGASEANVFYWQHGDCYFMSHHGDKIKGDKLPQLFAQQIMDNHIKTRHRKIYLGHVHHKSFTENAICEVQTYRTLAAKDAYAASHGYIANRSITAETWHKKYGEVSQVNVTIPMIEDNV